MSEPEAKRTKYHVWKARYSDARSQRWQRIMRRASRISKWSHGFELLEIYGQRSFRCEYCPKCAVYAHYGSLSLLCQEHAEWFLEFHGITPWWKSRAKSS